MNNTLGELYNAVDVAVDCGASVVSMSWGTPEFSAESVFDHHFYDPAGVTFVASSGDNGNPGLYPAASPYVVAVGGTRLPLDRRGNRAGPETAWSGSGGGISPYEPLPSYQSDYPIPATGGYRGYPDVSYNADPVTGFAVYLSHPYNGVSGWVVLGGTSAGTPQWAALIALANERRNGDNLSSDNLLSSPLYDAAKQQRWYYHYGAYLDVKSGSNGACGAVCTATRGYDFVTGLGSPNAGKLVAELAED
jgi:subtilase family serine protease